MGVYNASKHAVVGLTETLYHDLRIAGGQVGCSLLCPAFVPTGIANAERARPESLRNDAPLTRVAEARRQAVDESGAGRTAHGAAEVAEITFDAIRERRFYVITHPSIMASVQLRLDDIAQLRNPTDPMSLKPR